MKKVIYRITALIVCATVLCSATPLATGPDNRPLKIRYVDFKKCVESSKLGLDEKANFEAMKKNMETNFGEKQKDLNTIATKLNDPDYLDSLSPEAETDLKRKFRALNQELAEMESQSYQLLNQTNFKVIQKLTEAVSAASKKIAKRDSIDVILNEESCFFESSDLDITDTIVKEMDVQFDTSKRGT